VLAFSLQAGIFKSFLHQVPPQINIVGIGVVKPDQIVHIISVHPYEQYGQIETAISKCIGQTVRPFGPGVANIGFILLVDNTISIQIPEFDIPYPYIVLTDGQSIAIVIHRNRTVLSVLHRLEQSVIQVSPEQPRRLADSRSLLPVITRTRIPYIPGNPWGYEVCP